MVPAGGKLKGVAMKRTVIAAVGITITVPLIAMGAFVLAAMAIEWPEEDDA